MGIITGEPDSFGRVGAGAFLWDATHGMRSLQQLLIDEGVDMTGWSLSGAYGVSRDGVYSVLLAVDQEAVAVRLRPRDDGAAERDEVLRVTLAPGDNYKAFPALSGAELRLADNDRPVVTLLAEDGTAREGVDDRGTVLLSRSGDLSQELTVHLQVDPASTAAWGIDYEGLTLTPKFAAGSAVARVEVVPLADRRHGSRGNAHAAPAGTQRVQRAGRVRRRHGADRGPPGRRHIRVVRLEHGRPLRRRHEQQRPDRPVQQLRLRQPAPGVGRPGAGRLSDPMAEEMLQDRISFRRFVGLSFDDRTPDHSTISTFRKRLRERGHGSTLFDKTLEVLRSRGLVMNEGTLIDATIIEAPLGSRRVDGSRTTDPCATKTFKHGRPYNGYRAHIAADSNGIITDFVYDTAAESEHTHFDHLARNETAKVYVDSGCRSKERVERLEKRGVFAGLCHRRVKGQKELTAEQKGFNRLVSGVRAMVEHPFAWIKRMTGGRTRYRGCVRNALDFALSAGVYNFRRSFTIKPAAVAAAAR